MEILKQTIASIEAKTHFSELLTKISREKSEYIITRSGKPIAVLSPYIEKKDISEGIAKFIKYRNDRCITLKSPEQVKEIAHQDHRF